MESRYEKVRLLGSGSFGKAWLVRSKLSQRQYVIKELPMSCRLSAKEYEQVFNEVQIIKSCSHVNIIRYKEYFSSMDSSEYVMNIVMEFADAGDLCQCIRRRRQTCQGFLPETQIRNWFVQICLGLQYIHKKNILHRDIKTQNIFLCSNGLLKLGDFGISRTLKDENDFAVTGIGTLEYLSPEICRKQPYDHKSDIWGLGCVLYEMCALKAAFRGKELVHLVPDIISANYPPLPAHFSIGIAELVKVMLTPDPCLRPTTQQILNAKVLKDDLLSYLVNIRTLYPGSYQDEHRKESISSTASSALSSSSTSSSSSSSCMDSCGR